MPIQGPTRGVLLAACLSMVTGASAETLVIGVINRDIKKEMSRTEPLAAYLEADLADAGVTSVEVEVIPSPDAMARALTEGSVDVVFDSVLVAGQVALASGSQPFVRRWKGGVATYHSVILVPVASEMDTIEDLVGRRIGFEEPDSTSGFLLPAGLIRQAGLPLSELRSHQEAPPPGEVGYVFTDDDKNTLIWLMSGWIDAAATDPQRFAELDAAQPNTYRVLARSAEVPRQVGIHRGDLDPALVARLTEALSGMHQTGGGLEALGAFDETSRFDSFPDGVDATFAPIYDMLNELETLGVL